ncbi:hypothetical protein CLOSPI_02056 [Thomasclavelia spiroformis DSM 1552]|uniref:Uncharacterized protein n=1 Tax=Thomasclavelia spiroformis DSM 1552 TaxID=428126 RepID=B1C488_9FIRM|nr:hypothetical protein CLOSPI_02056 [Thomasclavelia spiroformis DSM 1552]
MNQKVKKGEVIISYGTLYKENQFLRGKHTDHKEMQGNETAGACG